MRETRIFTLVFGIAYIVVGVIGFIPVFSSSVPASAPHIDITSGYRYLFGNFPINVTHNLVHILIGVAGVVCYARFAWSRLYCRTLFLVYGLLTVLGFIPHANTLGGLAPIFGSDTWLHAVSALAAGLFGYVVSEEDTPAELVAQHAH